MTELLTVKVRLPTERVDQGAYTIESVDSADEGRYFCRATNPLGTAEASVQVNMLGTSELFFPDFRRCRRLVRLSYLMILVCF